MLSILTSLVVSYLVGFVCAAGLVLPFVGMRHARRFADCAASEIRG